MVIDGLARLVRLLLRELRKIERDVPQKSPTLQDETDDDDDQEPNDD